MQNKEILQRSEEWFQSRKGRFTASNIDNLLGKITLQRTKDKIENYAITKAGEMYFDLSNEESYISKDMQRGIDLEPLAFANFQDKLRLNFLEVLEAPFIKYGLNAGASPDGILSNGENLEIKCPTLETFQKLVIKKEVKPVYFAQMQMQMLCLDTDLSHFHNYIIHNGVPFSFTLEVPRHEETIDLLKDRIEYATEIKLNHYNELIKNLG
jgi:putative phage-type endonuclease